MPEERLVLDQGQQGPLPSYEEDEIDLLNILKVILKHRRLILTTVALITIAVGVISLWMPNLYTATATLLPIEKSTSGNLSSVLGSMGALGGGLGTIASQAGLGGKDAATKFVTILSTRTMTESVITKQQLKHVLYDSSWDPVNHRWKEPWFRLGWGAGEAEPSMQDAVKEMGKIVAIDSDKKNGVVSVSFKAKDPQLAARVANAYIAELNLYLNKNALSTAKRNRLFIEGQLKKARTEMADYEVALKNFQQANKLVSLSAQTEASVKAYAELKARLISAEVTLSLLESSSLEGDPRVARARNEVTELKMQLGRFENGSGSGPLVAFQRVPAIGLEFARLTREVMIREKVFELLTQQYEMAKIQEAQEDISFLVLDTAIPPEKKSGPKRTFNVLLALVASTILGIFLAFGAEYWANHREEFHKILDRGADHASR